MSVCRLYSTSSRFIPRLIRTSLLAIFRSEQAIISGPRLQRQVPSVAYALFLSPGWAVLLTLGEVKNMGEDCVGYIFMEDPAMLQYLIINNLQRGWLPVQEPSSSLHRRALQIASHLKDYAMVYENRLILNASTAQTYL